MINSSLHQLGSALRAGKISSVELTQLYLDRIAELNPALNAYVTIKAETSLDQARRADTLLAGGKAPAAHRHSGRAKGHLLCQGLAHHLRFEDAGKLHRTL